MGATGAVSDFVYWTRTVWRTKDLLSMRGHSSEGFRGTDPFPENISLANNILEGGALCSNCEFYPVMTYDPTVLPFTRYKQILIIHLFMWTKTVIGLIEHTTVHLPTLDQFKKKKNTSHQSTMFMMYVGQLECGDAFYSSVCRVAVTMLRQPACLSQWLWFYLSSCLQRQK